VIRTHLKGKPPMKTYSRGTLRKLVEAGRVVMTNGYHYDDMMGESRTGGSMPVQMKPENWQNRKDGVCYLTVWDLTAKSGCAYCRDDDPSAVTLIVHSNSNYELRILPEKE
jgi:hypothetical protein